MNNLTSPFIYHNLRKQGINPPTFKVVKIQTEENRLLRLKTFSVAFLILLQLAIIIIIHFIATHIFFWYLGFSFTVTLICCVCVLSSKKHGLSKSVWILFLLLTFYFGYTIYILSHEKIFFGKSRKKYNKRTALSSPF